MPLDQSQTEIHARHVHETVLQLSILARRHQAAVKEQTILTNLLKARARTYHGLIAPEKGDRLDKPGLDKLYKRLIERQEDPLFSAECARLFDPRAAAGEEQKRLAKEMGKLAKTLPVWEAWGAGQRGFGEAGLGKIIGYAPGDDGNSLSDFETPAKLWRWFGHEVRDGIAPSKKRSGGKKLGFSPMRQSVLWNIGEGLIKAGIRRDKETNIVTAISEWGQMYLDRKVYEVDAAARRGVQVMAADQIPTKANGEKMTPEEGYMNLLHVHNRAARYMRKAFLQRLWEEWTGHTNPHLADRTWRETPKFME